MCACAWCACVLPGHGPIDRSPERSAHLPPSRRSPHSFRPRRPPLRPLPRRPPHHQRPPAHARLHHLTHRRRPRPHPPLLRHWRRLLGPPRILPRLAVPAHHSPARAAHLANIARRRARLPPRPPQRALLPHPLPHPPPPRPRRHHRQRVPGCRAPPRSHPCTPPAAPPGRRVGRHQPYAQSSHRQSPLHFPTDPDRPFRRRLTQPAFPARAP